MKGMLPKACRECVHCRYLSGLDGDFACHYCYDTGKMRREDITPGGCSHIEKMSAENKQKYVEKVTMLRDSEKYGK